jgi:hypothetical protein
VIFGTDRLYGTANHCGDTGGNGVKEYISGLWAHSFAFLGGVNINKTASVPVKALRLILDDLVVLA